MKKALTIIAVNCAFLCTLIVGIEIFSQFVYLVRFGNFYFMQDADEELSVNGRIFEIHPYLAGRPRASVAVHENNISIKTTGLHTRWTGGSQDDTGLIRIAILGGSTAFGTCVSDKDSWPALLQAKLGKGFSVTNYGVPGYSTAEAIIQMALIVPEKRPHIVLFYEGWNDIRNYHENDLGADYYGHGMRQYRSLDISAFQKKKSSFATAWLIARIKNKFAKPPEKNYKLFTEPDLFVDKIYIRNLRTLKLLTENIHAFGVFIPQVLNYSDYLGKEGSHKWTRHIKNDALPTLMERFNSLMKGLCSQSDSNCVVLSEVTKVKWLPDDFEDAGHFSEKGGLKFAEILAQLIRTKSDNTDRESPQWPAYAN